MFLYPEWIGFESVCLCIHAIVSRNVASVFEITAVNLMVGWCEFACVVNLSISGLLTSHNENVVHVSFPNHWLYDAFAKNLCLKIGHKDICKGNGHFSTHGFGYGEFVDSSFR